MSIVLKLRNLIESKKIVPYSVMKYGLSTKTICVTQITEIKTLQYLSSLWEDMIMSVFFFFWHSL